MVLDILNVEQNTRLVNIPHRLPNPSDAHEEELKGSGPRRPRNLAG